MNRLLRYIRSRIRGEETTKRLIAKGLVVGKNFYRGTGVTIDSAHCWLIRMGDNVKLAPYVHILAHDAAPFEAFGYTRIGLVTIGDNVQIGAHTIILPGVTIGNNVGIAAGSVVGRDIPDDSFVAGNPARRVGMLSEKIGQYKELLEAAPKYGEEYTLRGNITAPMKEKMIAGLQGGVIGFVK